MNHNPEFDNGLESEGLDEKPMTQEVDEFDRDYDYGDEFDGEEDVVVEPDDICQTCDSTGEFPIGHVCKSCGGSGHTNRC